MIVVQILALLRQPQADEERKAEQIRLLMDQRQARLARAEQAKAEAAAQRRAAKKSLSSAAASIAPIPS